MKPSIPQYCHFVGVAPKPGLAIKLCVGFHGGGSLYPYLQLTIDEYIKLIPFDILNACHIPRTPLNLGAAVSAFPQTPPRDLLMDLLAKPLRDLATITIAPHSYEMHDILPQLSFLLTLAHPTTPYVSSSYENVDLLRPLFNSNSPT